MGENAFNVAEVFASLASDEGFVTQLNECSSREEALQLLEDNGVSAENVEELIAYYNDVVANSDDMNGGFLACFLVGYAHNTDVAVCLSVGGGGITDGGIGGGLGAGFCANVGLGMGILGHC